MEKLLGIDVGYSNIDFAFMENKRIAKLFSIPISDNADILQAIESNGIDASKVSKFLSNKSLNLNGYKIKKIDCIAAIANGALHCANKKKALIVSCGTGTCIVDAGKKTEHIGGTPVGGGMLLGLSRLLLGTDDIQTIEQLAKKGDISKVDLLIKDLYPDSIGLYDKDASAAYFSRLEGYSKEDLALALCNFIAQTIATLAVFAAKSCNQSEIIMTGRLPKINLIKNMMEDRIKILSNFNIIVPKDFEYATAIGVALSRQ